MLGSYPVDVVFTVFLTLVTGGGGNSGAHITGARAPATRGCSHSGIENTTPASHIYSDWYCYLHLLIQPLTLFFGNICFKRFVIIQEWIFSLQ